MDAPPIPRLVDLVHAFNGVVVEHFKKRVEKLFSDSIPLWRLLKLLFKILHSRKRQPVEKKFLVLIVCVEIPSDLDWRDRSMLFSNFLKL